MQNAGEKTNGIIPDPRPASRGRISLATSLAMVAAIATSCALVVQISRAYAAIPAFSSPACPEVYATPVVLLWIILGKSFQSVFGPGYRPRFHDLIREFFDEAPLAGIVAYSLCLFQRRPERRLIPILPRHPINVFG